MVDLKTIDDFVKFLLPLEIGSVTFTLSLGYLLGREHVGGLKDGKSGIGLIWAYISKVHLRDLRNLEYLPPEEKIIEKYKLGNYFNIDSAVTNLENSSPLKTNN